MKIESRACRRFLFCFLLACSGSGLEAQPPINVSSGRLAVSVDPSTCRWSASVIGTPMQLNDVYFLPNDDPSGWTVSGSVNPDDSGVLGSFLTVTLRGEKPGQLDFEYQISVSKTGTDLLVSLGRSNSTGHPVDLDDMDTFVSNDARLGRHHRQMDQPRYPVAQPGLLRALVV
jgi:hypothetical protein